MKIEKKKKTKKEKRTKGKDRISRWIEGAFAEATARFRSHEIQASAPNGGRISHSPRSPVSEAVCAGQRK